jgi:hypothetical protein
MRQLSAGLLAIALALALAVAAPAMADDTAKKEKHKKPHAAHKAKVVQRQRANDVFPPGPVYHANEYLGDDPDPFIRGHLLRDLGAHYGPPD